MELRKSAKKIGKRIGDEIKDTFTVWQGNDYLDIAILYDKDIVVQSSLLSKPQRLQSNTEFLEKVKIEDFSSLIKKVKEARN